MPREVHKNTVNTIKKDVSGIGAQIDAAFSDLFRIIYLQEEIIQEKELYIKGLEDELKIYTERGPWNNGTIRV